MDSQYSGKLLEAVSPVVTSDPSHPQTILHRVYTAVIQGDFNLFGEHLTEDVELHIRGFPALDGTWRGRKEVVAATRKNFAALDGQKPIVESMISQADSVAVLIRESGTVKASGEAYSIRGVQWFTFVKGKISKIDEIVCRVG
jgi:ketosteroid isomerase-like protein